MQLLKNRGVSDPEEAEKFLNPSWDKDAYDPFLFNNMNKAVKLVFEKLENGEVITVHGDYDADGVCGTTVLITTLRDICRRLNFDETKLSFYIPHREKEGYGLSPQTAQKLEVEHQTKLIITVDCGISNKEAIDLAFEKGIQTIVCDHHTIPENLPEKAILIHPLVEGEKYPNKSLCGTGVAFKLASALIKEAQNKGAQLPDGYEKWLLDLVAIATVTDIMPLLGENRTLEKFGLQVLSKSRRSGLKQLMQVAGVNLDKITSHTIGFQIGPRINAAGRMNHAHDALDLLLEEDAQKAAELAMALDKTNQDRRVVSEKMYQEAKGMVGDDPDKSVIFAVNPEWSPGIVGLVAGKLVRDYQRPVYVVGGVEGALVGSGRSIGGFHVTEALRSASQWLEKFGGHPEACGFSAKDEENLNKVIEQVYEYANLKARDLDFVEKINVDSEIVLSDLDLDLAKSISEFAPFGEKNPEPIFLSKDVMVLSTSLVGKSSTHLKMTVQGPSGKILKCIGFSLGSFFDELSFGDKINLVYHVDINEWNGFSEVQARIIDLKKL